MPKQVIINCLTISIIFALLAPSFLLVTFIPNEGEAVYDVNKIESDKFTSMSTEEATDYMNKIPLKKVSGIERFTYMFSQPSAGIQYLKTSIWLLIPFLLATMSTNYLNIKYVIKRERV